MVRIKIGTQHWGDADRIFDVNTGSPWIPVLVQGEEGTMVPCQLDLKLVSRGRTAHEKWTQLYRQHKPSIKETYAQSGVDKLHPTLAPIRYEPRSYPTKAQRTTVPIINLEDTP